MRYLNVTVVTPGNTRVIKAKHFEVKDGVLYVRVWNNDMRLFAPGQWLTVDANWSNGAVV